MKQNCPELPISSKLLLGNYILNSTTSRFFLNKN